MKTAILTGFAPFGKYVVNPTAILARDLQEKVIAGHLIHSIVLRTSVLLPNQAFGYEREVGERLTSYAPDVIISLGIASDVKGIRIESRCFNWLENDTYCTPFENRRPLFNDLRPQQEMSARLEEWDLAALDAQLSKVGIPFEISDDPGRYCCNALMCWFLRMLADSSQQIPYLFAHLPCTEESIAGIDDFDRIKKTLLRQDQFPTIVEKLLSTYHPASE